MSRKRSINDLIDLRVRAASRASSTGSRLAARAAELANQYIGNIDNMKSVRNAYDRANEEFRKENVLRKVVNGGTLNESQKTFFKNEMRKKREKGVRIMSRSDERKYSPNTYKGQSVG